MLAATLATIPKLAVESSGVAFFLTYLSLLAIRLPYLTAAHLKAHADSDDLPAIAIICITCLRSSLLSCRCSWRSIIPVRPHYHWHCLFPPHSWLVDDPCHGSSPLCASVLASLCRGWQEGPQRRDGLPTDGSAGHLRISLFLRRHRHDGSNLRRFRHHNGHAQGHACAFDRLVFFNTVLVAAAVNAAVSLAG